MRKYHNLFWAGILLVLIIIGGRIAWVQYANRTWNHFVNRKTSFTLLESPYQPDWKKTGTLMHSSGCSTSSSSGVCQSLPPFKEKITQELASDSFGKRFLHGYAEWVVTASAESSMQPEHYLTVSLNEEAHSRDECRVNIRSDYKTRSQVVRLEISEGFRGQAREVTLFFKLTPDGFVYIEDEEEQ